MSVQQQDLQIVKRCVNGILKDFDYQRRELNQRWLKELKNVVRKNEKIIDPFIDRLFEEFQKDDCDRRLGAVLIADYFFQRSHAFRRDFLSHFQDFLLYVIEVDPLHYPLPDPPDAAAALKKESLKIIKSWIDKFEKGYSKLTTAQIYLTKCKNFDFAAANEQLLVERQRAEEARIRKEVQAKKIGDKVMKLFKEIRQDIQRTITECRSSANLIYPDIFREEDADKHSTSAAITAERTALHGYAKDTAISVTIGSAIIPIEENVDNSALIDALRDSKISLEFYEKKIKKWLKHLSEAGGEYNSSLIRQLVDIKSSISNELKRCSELDIKREKKKKRKADSDESDDSDFEDVVKEDLELEMQEPEEEEEQIEEMEKKQREPIAGPSGLNSSKSPAKPEGDEGSPKKIPHLAYGLDLKYWGEDVEPALLPRNEFDGHRFWRASDPDQDVGTEVEDVYRSRQMTFITDRPAIQHQCRAPLPSGRLCPRMDLERCPFHGKIVERDDMGFPVEELGKSWVFCVRKYFRSIEMLEAADKRMQQKIADDEAEYVRDVEMAVGIPLAKTDKTRQRASKNRNYGTARKREKPESALSRERLEKKLFNRSALKRVAETLTSIQQEKAKKNFSSQFNYAVTNRR